jgi:hypothetical protein
MDSPQSQSEKTSFVGLKLQNLLHSVVSVSDRQQLVKVVVRFALPLSIAVVLPIVIHFYGNHQGSDTSGIGLALLPTLYVAGWKLRQSLYKRFFYLPVLCIIIYLLETNGRADNGLGWALLPMIAVLIHYAVVTIAAYLSISHRIEIDSFCQSVSDYLDDKCYQQQVWPLFLYMKRERVLLSFACIVKIAVAVVQIVLAGAILGVPSDVAACRGTTSHEWATYAWIMYSLICLSECLYHAAMFLSGNLVADRSKSVRKSFSVAVLHPTYWQWYFIAQVSCPQPCRERTHTTYEPR